MVVAQANAYADAIYNPQQDAVMRRIQLINDQTAARNNSLSNVYGPQARQNVSGAYDILDSMLGTNKANAIGALNTQANQIGQGYRDTADLGIQMRDQSRNTLAQLAQSMQAGDYAMPGISNLEAEANRMIQANRDRDQNMTANLRNWIGQAGSIYDAQIGTGKQMRTGAMTDIENAILKAIGENNLSGAEQVTDMNDRLTELLGERGKYLAGLIQEMQAQEFERSLKQAQLDMQAQELNARTADSAADRALRREAMDREGQMSEKEKLQLQMQAWGMNRDILESDRNFGLEQSKFGLAKQQAMAPQGMSPDQKWLVDKYMQDGDMDLESAMVEAGIIPYTSAAYNVGSGIRDRAQGAIGGIGQSLGNQARLQAALAQLAKPSTRPASTIGGALPYTVYPGRFRS